MDKQTLPVQACTSLKGFGHSEYELDPNATEKALNSLGMPNIGSELYIVANPYTAVDPPHIYNGLYQPAIGFDFSAKNFKAVQHQIDVLPSPEQVEEYGIKSYNEYAVRRLLAIVANYTSVAVVDTPAYRRHTDNKITKAKLKSIRNKTLGLMIPSALAYVGAESITPEYGEVITAGVVGYLGRLSLKAHRNDIERFIEDKAATTEGDRDRMDQHVRSMASQYRILVPKDTEQFTNSDYS